MSKQTARELRMALSARPTCPPFLGGVLDHELWLRFRHESSPLRDPECLPVELRPAFVAFLDTWSGRELDRGRAGQRARRRFRDALAAWDLVLEALAPPPLTLPRRRPTDPLRLRLAEHRERERELETLHAALHRVLAGDRVVPASRARALRELELQHDATDADIRQRYRELVRAHHPDHGGRAERARAINAAKAMLGV